MQEAYIVVDYERGNFSVHQALFPPTTVKKQIQPITVPQSTSDKSSSGLSSPGRLRREEIAGIVVGTAVFMLLCFGLVAFWRQRQQRHQQNELQQNCKLEGAAELQESEQPIMEHSGEERYEMPQSPLSELDSAPKAELDSGKKPVPELFTDPPREQAA